MFWAFISNILQSIDTVYYKKALSVANLPNILFARIGELTGVIISIILIVINGFDLSSLSWITIAEVALIIGIVTCYDYFDQKTFKKEKISDILPYTNLNTIFTIIIGFLIFKDASVGTFIVSILAFLVTIAFSVDFKNLTLPKNIKTIVFSQILQTTETLVTGRLLKNLADREYYIIYEGLVIALLFIAIVVKGFLGNIKNIKPKFYLYRFGGSVAGNISWLLYLFMVGEFGIVLSILFSFIGTGVTMLFGYLFLKEKPSKKDIIMTVIIGILVGIGFMFK